jgi:hypothetical protein
MNIADAFGIIEEQIAVRFTGKINIQVQPTSQHLGHIFLAEGDIIQVSYKSHEGLKAFYSIFIDIEDGGHYNLVVEPEVAEGVSRNIHYPYKVLTGKVNKLVENYRVSAKNRPPNAVKLTINSDFIKEGDDVTANEFDVLCTLSDFNRVGDIYQHTNLIEFEVTEALVSLRKKNAIKVLKQKPAEVRS